MEKQQAEGEVEVKVYESAAKNLRIGKIRFIGLAGTPFGVCDVNDPMLVRKTGMSPAEISEMIERNPEFTGRKVGQVGVWPRSERIMNQADEKFDAIERSLIALGEPALRKMIAESGLQAPVAAPIEELASLALKARAARQKPVAPLDEDAPVSTAKPSLKRGARAMKDFDPKN
jgi:hypothetical protein